MGQSIDEFIDYMGTLKSLCVVPDGSTGWRCYLNALRDIDETTLADDSEDIFQDELQHVKYKIDRATKRLLRIERANRMSESVRRTLLRYDHATIATSSRELPLPTL